MEARYFFTILNQYSTENVSDVALLKVLLTLRPPQLYEPHFVSLKLDYN